jgi:hypothetical protein
VVNARHPAPVSHRVAVTHRLLNAMWGALHQAVPHLIPAASYGNSYGTTFQTVAGNGAREVLVEIEIGGSGAHPAKDGVNAYASGMHQETASAPQAAMKMAHAVLPCSNSHHDARTRVTTTSGPRIWLIEKTRVSKPSSAAAGTPAIAWPMPARMPCAMEVPTTP